MPRIERRNIHNLDSEPLYIYGSEEDLHQELIAKGENQSYADAFIELLFNRGFATDRFFHYLINDYTIERIKKGE